MKRTLTIFLAIAIVLSVSACGNKADISNASAVDVAASVKSALTFVDDMLEVKNEIVEDFYNLPEGVSEMKVYMSSSGATSEELAIFKCKDAQTAELVKKACEKRIEDLNEKFEDYIPGELVRIENAIIKERDGFVMFVCADSPASAEEKFEDYK